MVRAVQKSTTFEVDLSEEEYQVQKFQVNYDHEEAQIAYESDKSLRGQIEINGIDVLEEDEIIQIFNINEFKHKCNPILLNARRQTEEDAQNRKRITEILQKKVVPSAMHSPRPDFPPIRQIDMTNVKCQAIVTDELLGFLIQHISESRPLEGVIFWGVNHWKGIKPQVLDALAAKCEHLMQLGICATEEDEVVSEQVEAALTNFATGIAVKAPLTSISLYGFTSQHEHHSAILETLSRNEKLAETLTHLNLSHNAGWWTNDRTGEGYE